MLSEILPFWTKYWYHILLVTVSCVILKLFYKEPKRSNEQRNASLVDVALEQEEETTLETLIEDDEEPALSKDLEHVPFEYDKPSEAVLLTRASEFYNITAARRTVRSFSSDSVPKEVVREIIRAAGTAPSGAHTEPWTYLLVSSERVKQEIRNIIEYEEEINYKKRMGTKWTTDLLPLRTNWIKEYLTDAPYLILVFKQTYGTLPNGKRKIHYYNEMSVSIACGILITAIQYAGLVTLTSTPLNCGPAIRKLLRRPSNEKLVLLLPVGYPAKDATVPALERKSLSEILIEMD